MLKKTITALSLLCILAACQSDDNSSPQPKPRKPEAGAYSETAGVHPSGMPEAWLERGDTVRPVHRGIRLVSTLSVFHRRVAGIPPQDTSTTGRWYREYQPLVALVPRSGTRRTLVRYFSYQAVVRTVPSKEIYWYMHTTDRQQGIQYEFTNIFSLSLFPVSAGLYKTET